MKKYRDDILYPISFDEAGTKAQMWVFFDAAEMQAKGTPPEDLKKMIQQRYKANYYKAPERAGVSYMLSPNLRMYLSPDQNEDVATANVPHGLYYAPSPPKTSARQPQCPNNCIISASMGGGWTRRIQFSYCTALMDTWSNFPAQWRGILLPRSTKIC